MAKYWIKLHHKTLYDPDMDRLEPILYKRAIQCFLLAGEQDEGGVLPPLDDIAYALRETPHRIRGQIDGLIDTGIIEKKGKVYRVRNFTKYQGATSKADFNRMRREQKRDGNGVDSKPGYFNPVKIPDVIETDKFQDAWHLWCDHLDERNKTLTLTQVNGILGNLGKMGEKRAIEAINYSIERGWISIYEKSILGGGRPSGWSGDALNAWDKVLTEVKRVSRDGKPELDETSTKAVNRMGGWKEICNRPVQDAQRAFLSQWSEVANG